MEFLEPGELFLGIVPGVEADGVCHLLLLLKRQGGGAVVPEGKEFLVADGVEGGEVAVGEE